MTKSVNPELNQDTPFASAPAADDVSRGKEVFAPTEGPFESPAKEFVPGPYYKAVEEKMEGLDERPVVPNSEEAEKKKWKVDRRDLVKMFSVSTLAASSACVRRPVEKVVPYVNQPLDQVPGVPTYYASTCGGCTAGCGIMVKTREGRPVKIEGLPGHPITNGKLCSVGQATLQGLYHPERRESPAYRFGSKFDNISWEDTYALLGKKLAGKTKVAILTKGGTGHSDEFMKDFLNRIGSDEKYLYSYEPNSLLEAMIAAHEIAFGVSAIPRPDLQNAKHIVGIGSDFLEVGVSSVYMQRGFSASNHFRRDGKGHYTAFESTMTNTGAQADDRLVIAPGTESVVTLLLVRSLLENNKSKGSGASRQRIKALLEGQEALLTTGYSRAGVKREVFDKLAEQLLSTPSVVLAGGSQNFDENSTSLQLAAIAANELIGSYESVLHLAKGAMTAPVKAGDMARFLNDANELEAVIIIDSNPAFTLPKSWEFDLKIKQIETVVSIQAFPNETDELADFVLPGNHFLESWGDEQPVAGFWSARQPVVRQMTMSRQAEDILLWTAASLDKPLPYKDYRDYLMNKWKGIYTSLGVSGKFEVFWQQVLHKGFIGKIQSKSVAGLQDFTKQFAIKDLGTEGLRFIAPLDQRLRAGEGAHLPVLQEIGDSMSTVTWDTWVSIHPKTAHKLGVRRNDVVKLETAGGAIEVAVYPMPGMHPNAIVVHRGNGHRTSGTIEGGTGIDPLLAVAKAADSITGAAVTSGQTVKVTKTGRVYRLAALQKHNDIANRTDIIKEISLANAVKYQDKVVDLDDVPNLYPPLPTDEYKWGLAVDLSRCNGCGACMVACDTENNVPQVGREQILMGREMH